MLLLSPVFKLNYVAASAVNCDGGAAKVDHSVVIGLLNEILALLTGLLADLHLLGKSDYSSCSLGDLSGVIGGLLIVRYFFVFFRF
jgi:hypothetical protein